MARVFGLRMEDGCPSCPGADAISDPAPQASWVPQLVSLYALPPESWPWQRRRQEFRWRFCETHASSAESLTEWHKLTENVIWTNLKELKQTFPSADLIKGNLFVFNVNGNHCRVIVRINFERKTIFIKDILTHAEYDKINFKNRKTLERYLSW